MALLDSFLDEITMNVEGQALQYLPLAVGLWCICLQPWQSWLEASQNQMLYFWDEGPVKKRTFLSCNRKPWSPAGGVWEEQGLLLNKAKPYLPQRQKKRQPSLLGLWHWQRNPVLEKSLLCLDVALTRAMIVISIALGNTLRGKTLMRINHRKGNISGKERRAQRMHGGNVFEDVTYFLPKALLRNISRYACPIISTWKLFESINIWVMLMKVTCICLWLLSEY